MGRRKSVVNQKTLCAFRKNRRLARLRALQEGKEGKIDPKTMQENVLPDESPSCSITPMEVDFSLPLKDNLCFEISTADRALLDDGNKENVSPIQIEENVLIAESQPDCSGTPEQLDFLPLYDHTYFKSSTPVSQPISVEPEISGRRIFNVEYLFKQILNEEKHSPFDCSIIDMDLIQETRNGMNSTFLLKCKMCNIIKKITNEECGDDNIDINAAITLGAISTGIGYSQVEELCAVLNMPCMAMKTYNNQHQKMSEVILNSTWETMTKAAREEAEHARAIGNVDVDGVPCITVVTDGAWAKRSYNVNYNSSSGVACIVGLHTGKLLFLGIRNKYCSVCCRKPGGENVPHTCYKNWSDSSTAMETDIIVEGFRTSVQIHNLKFLKMVGDGDSSVYKKLLETKPYGNKIVEKIECINHLLRNFSKKLREISNRKRSQTKNAAVHPFLRKAVLSNILKFRTAITKATEHRRQERCEFMEKVRLLQLDLENVPSHIFGEHSKCTEIGYFKCKPAPGEKNLLPLMRECGLDQDIRIPLQRLMDNCSSLLLNMKNNIAEQFNSVVCKFVGGKRINFSLRGSYKTRCEAAALSFNVGGDYYQNLHKSLTKSSPKKFTKKYIQKMKKRRVLKKKRLFKPKVKQQAKADKDYGPEANSLALSLDDKQYINKKTEFLMSLQKTKQEINKIAKETVGQSVNPQWIQERSLRLTASNFGRVSKRRKGSTVNLVKNLLYSNFLGNKATKYGNDSEPLAKGQLQEKLDVRICESGFYIHPEEHYLGASPDGLIGDDGMVEIKCPVSISKLHPLDAISENKIKFATIVDGSLKIKRNHNYYYQVQGQLAATNRQWCIFCIWSPLGFVTEKIYRDDKFWQLILPKLKKFYFSCLLPELVDPQYVKGLPIREIKID